VGNIAQHLLDTATKEGGRPALRMGEAVVTYDEFAESAGRVAAGLAARGITPGDRVALVLPNVPSFPVVQFGALLAGAVAVPVNPLLAAREIAYYLRDSGARLVVAADASAGRATEAADAVGIAAIAVHVIRPATIMAGRAQTGPVPRAPDDDAAILYTSGRTGPPKGAELTHGNLSGNARTTVDTLLETTPDDVIMGCLPLFHPFGLTCGLNAAVLTASTLTLLPRFAGGAALEVIAQEGVTVFEGVPAMFSAMLAFPGAEVADVSSLRLCVSGGAAMPVETLRSFEETFGRVVLEGYGLAETSPVVSFNHPHVERRVGSIGTPIRGVEMRLVDDAGHDVPLGQVGEIAVRGPNVMKGYRGKPEETARAIPDGWLRTGDLARKDDDGYFAIVDRRPGGR
jgi:long-chain acyl-CoA synthetase